MRAILSTGDGDYLMTIERPDGVAMIGLNFDSWLDASITGNYMVRSKTIEVFVDRTGEDVKFNATGGIDNVFQSK